jgi:hypothetical protein
MPLAGADALVFHRIDAVEHERRAQVDAAPLDAFRPLEMLMSLPVGVAVPRASLSARLQPEVRILPRGSAAWDHMAVTRLAIRPIRVDLVLVRAPGWRGGLGLAGQFSPFARRAMVLERVPRRIDELLIEADYHGIGVFVPRGQSVEMLLAPAPYRPARFTTAAWRFAEQVYRQLAESGRAA